MINFEQNDINKVFLYILTNFVCKLYILNIYNVDKYVSRETY